MLDLLSTPFLDQSSFLMSRNTSHPPTGCSQPAHSQLTRAVWRPSTASLGWHNCLHQPICLRVWCTRVLWHVSDSTGQAKGIVAWATVDFSFIKLLIQLNQIILGVWWGLKLECFKVVNPKGLQDDPQDDPQNLQDPIQDPFIYWSVAKANQ